jgi:signal transduction histidine kinase
MVALRPTGRPSTADLGYGIPRLITQLAETLRMEETPPRAPYADVPHEISQTAALHGGDLLRRGFTLEQVVHDYGDLCQSITELAHDAHAPITVEEFHTFNRCLDSAIANAVTEFGRQYNKRAAEAAVRTQNDRLAVLATELRTSVNALDRSLLRLSDIVERTLAEVRLDHRRQVTTEKIELPAFLERLSVFAMLEAAAKGVDFKVSTEGALVVDADRELLSSAIAILLQNALRFTPAGGHVTLHTHTISERVAIEIEDECGGLQPTTHAELQQLLHDTGAERDGGISICRHAVNLTGATLALRELPHQGCRFTIELPKRA